MLPRVALWWTSCSLIGALSCASTPEIVPAGPEQGTFFSAPESTPRLGPAMNARRDRLEAATRAQLSVHFEVMRDLLESSREFRDQIQKRQAALIQRFEKDDEISPLDAELVLEAAHWFIELDALLYDLWTTYRRYLPNGSEPDPYAPYRAATLLSDDVRVKGGLIALTAEMVRMDNAALVVEVLGDELALTHWLNRGDASRGIEPESYDRIVGGLYDPGRRILLRDLLHSVDAHRDALKGPARDDGELAFMLATLARSSTAQALVKEQAVARQARFVGAVATRAGASLLSPALDLYISSIRDATSDDDSRFARLERIDGLAMRVESVLEPFDIVVVRDGRREGASAGYSYAAIYLGRFDQWMTQANKDDLNFSVVASELRQGDRFMELASDGPRYLSLDQILLGEELLVLRVERAEDAPPTSDDVLELLTRPEITKPPARNSPDHSAALVEEVFGLEALGQQASAGRIPIFGRFIQESLADESPLEVVIATSDGELVEAGDDAKAVIRRATLKRVPVFLEKL